MVKLGINSRLVSPKEIFENVGIVDTDYYRQLVESLRKLGILTSKVSTVEAQRLSKEKRISKKSIPRFLITMPSENISEILEKDISDYAKIFIGNVDYTATEQDIEELFIQFGEVSDVHIHKDRSTGKPRGSAIVEFESKQSLRKAFNYKKPLFLNDRKLILKEFRE